MHVYFTDRPESDLGSYRRQLRASVIPQAYEALNWNLVEGIAASALSKECL